MGRKFADGEAKFSSKSRWWCFPLSKPLVKKLCSFRGMPRTTRVRISSDSGTFYERDRSPLLEREGALRNAPARDPLKHQFRAGIASPLNPHSGRQSHEYCPQKGNKLTSQPYHQSHIPSHEDMHYKFIARWWRSTFVAKKIKRGISSSTSAFSLRCALCAMSDIFLLES